MSNLIDTACHRIRSYGLRKDSAHSILNCVTQWLQGSGTEWTVQRLKEYKNGLHRLLAGERWDHPWISICKDGCPNDPIGRLMASAIKHRNKRTIAKALAVTSLSSIFINPGQATEKQLKKFFGSMLDPSAVLIDEGLVQHLKVLTRSDLFVSRANTKTTGNGLTRYIASASETRRVPLTSGLRKERSCKETATGVWYEDHALEVIHAGLFKNSILPPESAVGLEDPSPFDEQSLYLAGIHRRNYKLLREMYDSGRDPVMGAISGIQEPGFKLRAVANPNRVVQIALQPLQSAIWTTLKGLKTDCTFNQESGITWAQRKLMEGHTMSSIDLSDATNRFPLSIQVEVLLELYPSMRKWISLFKEVSSLSWEDRVSGITRNVKFSVGQPLGLAPSFGSFALAHHLIMMRAAFPTTLPEGPSIRNLAVRCIGNNAHSMQMVKPIQLDQFTDSYRILGDDVIISDPRLAESYRGLMNMIGVEASPHKTLTSNLLCQFGGKDITKESIYPSYKIKGMSDNSFLDVVKTLGSPAKALLKQRQRRVVDLLAEVPKEFGGLGWNPKGKTYMQRIEENASIIEALSKDCEDEIFIRDITTVDINHGSAIGIDPRKWLAMFRARSTRSSDVTVAPKLLFKVAAAVTLNNMRVASDILPVSKGWVPATRPGDPRGVLLESFEKKLKASGVEFPSSALPKWEQSVEEPAPVTQTECYEEDEDLDLEPELNNLPEMGR